MQEGTDFELVTPAEWALLEMWYGRNGNGGADSDAAAGAGVAAGGCGPAILRRGVADAPVPTYGPYGGGGGGGSRRATVRRQETKHT